jgi:serine/threonine protein kinase
MESDRFLKEAQTMASLTHPTLLTASAKYPYLVMEYAPGRTLRDRVLTSSDICSKKASKLTLSILFLRQRNSKHVAIRFTL